MACKNCLKISVFLISIKLNTTFQYVLNPNMDITTTQEILLFMILLCTIVLFSGSMYKLHCLLVCFCACKTYALIILEPRMFETGNSYSTDCTNGCHFFCSKIHAPYHCITLFLLKIKSWRNTLNYNSHECWTCIQE